MREYLLRLHDGSYIVDDNAPSTFEDLCSNPGELKVWSGASEGTIWGANDDNYLFRAWHDSTHLRLGSDFSLEGELETARAQCEQASRAIGDIFADIVDAEVRGQVLYYAKHQDFPKDQLQFTRDFIKNGSKL